MWPELAAAPDALDSLDVSALVSDVLGFASGWQDLPVEVAGTILNRDLIEANPMQSRASLRVLGQARLVGWSGGPAAAREAPRLHVTWARRFVRDAFNVPLVGHTNWVWAVAAVPLRDGRVLLATGSRDGTVWLWDPTTRAVFGQLALNDSVSGIVVHKGQPFVSTRNGLIALRVPARISRKLAETDGRPRSANTR